MAAAGGATGVVAAGVLSLHPGKAPTAINSRKAQAGLLFIIHLPSFHDTQTAAPSRNPHR
jgi:hypothetical protein